MQKIALTPRSQELIKNYILGGAALGGSGALLTSLVNYMKTLKENGDPTGTEGDDSTLYVNLPANKMAAAQPSSGPADFSAGGLAITGGVLATAGTYALVRKLYQKMKLRELQEQLDNAQQSFVGQADSEAQQKLAAQQAPGGQPMSLGTMAYSTPVAFALLSAIAAGALTNHALNKTFPRVKPPSRIMPKRVVIRRTPNAQDGTLTEEEAKVAYDQLSDQEQYEDGMEFLTGLVLNSKSASESEVLEMVHAVAQGRHDEFVENIFELGFDAAMDTIKGASSKSITPQQKQMAIGLCVKSAALSPIFNMLVAAEYKEMAPRFSLIADLQDSDNKGSLIKIAGVLGALNRHDTFLVNPVDIVTTKEAASQLSMEEILRIINSQRNAINEGGEDGGIDEAEDMNKEDSISSQEEQRTDDDSPLDDGGAPDIINELGNDDDMIDVAMSQPTTPSTAVTAQMV